MPISLAEIMSSIIRPSGPIEYADPNRETQLALQTEHALQGRQKLAMDNTGQLMELRRQAELSKAMRAAQRMDLNERKFKLEQDKFAQAHNHEKELEDAYAALGQAMRGDPDDPRTQAAVSEARQRIERLGDTVNMAPKQEPSVAQTNPQMPTDNKPPAPTAPGSDKKAASDAALMQQLNSMERSQLLQIKGAPPKESSASDAANAYSGETTQLSPQEEQAFRAWAQANNVRDVDDPRSHYDYRGFWRDTHGQAIRGGVDHFPDTYKQHGHPTFSEESRYSRGPGDGGTWQGDRFIPGKPQIPGKDTQGFNPQGWLSPGDPLAQLSGGAPLQARPPTAPVTPNQGVTPMSSGANSAVQQNGQQPIGSASDTVLRPGQVQVIHNGKQALLLDAGPRAGELIASEFQPLVQGARNDDEKRAADMALKTATAVALREGAQAGREAGRRAYEFELNNSRKHAAIGKGTGGGSVGSGELGTGFGGSGMTKQEYGVNKEVNDSYRKVLEIYRHNHHIDKLNTAEQSLRSMIQAANANNGVGDIQAINSLIKTTQDRISDQDFRVEIGSSGLLSRFESLLGQFSNGQQSPEMMKQLREVAAQMATAIAQSKKIAADEAENAMHSASEFRSLSPDLQDELGQRARAEVLGVRLQNSAGRGSATRTGATKKPGGSSGLSERAIRILE